MVEFVSDDPLPIEAIDSDRVSTAVLKFPSIEFGVQLPSIRVLHIRVWFSETEYISIYACFSVRKNFTFSRFWSVPSMTALTLGR